MFIKINGFGTVVRGSLFYNTFGIVLICFRRLNLNQKIFSQFLVSGRHRSKLQIVKNRNRKHRRSKRSRG